MRTVSAAVAITVTSLAHAADVEITWSGRLFDAAGGALNGAHDLQITLYDDATAGTSSWTDTFSSVELQQGFATLDLGSQAVLTNDVFSGGPRWIEVTVDGVPLPPRHKLLSVPTAAVARGVRVRGAAVPGGCTGHQGELVFDTTLGALRVCDGSAWVSVGARNVVLDGGARRFSDGTAARSCLSYLHPPASYTYVGATGDGQYWVDPDGPGGNAEFAATCDMSLDGGGWLLVGWQRAGQPSAYLHTWADYALPTPTVTTGTPGMSSHTETLGAVLSGAVQDVRLTYRSGVTQGVLDIGPGTTRVFTQGSTWAGTLGTTNPLPIAARNTAHHNCAGYTYIAADGATSTPGMGCYIEFTNRHVGYWAACGNGVNGAYPASGGGAAWNLCFDNGDSRGNIGNSALGIWHNGAPTFHEVWETNFGSNTPANGTWNSAGGAWTWSAWIRPAN